MGRHKEELLLREEARHAAAERDGRRCSVCGEVVPYGEDMQNGMCLYHARLMTPDEPTAA